jgi:ABC-2 type transport system ATP-binding protein
MIISVKNLTKTYEYYKNEAGLLSSIKSLFSRKKLFAEAVKSISFDIKEGEFIGFIGPNGAGKTTTLKMLSGILYPSAGEVTVLGHKPFHREEAFQKQFALVMGQKNQLWWDLPAIESFLLNKAIYEIPDAKFKKNLDTLVELLDISDILNVQVRKLSLGQRMKCELAAALLHGPKVLFLDEPTIGLDVVSQKSIREFLKNYNRETKATILLTSHYMEDIRRLCERVIIIDHGVIIYDGKYKKLQDQYGHQKSVAMTFSNSVTKKDLETFGEVIEYEKNGSTTSATLTIPHDKTAEITAALLKKFPIDDISIHEKDMEEIIREIFGRK